MKKIASAIAALMLITAVGCGKKVGTSEQPELPQTPTTTAEATAEPTEDTTAPTTATEATTAEKSGYTVNEDGAVEFSAPLTEQKDDVLIKAANELFTAACNTEWNYSVGSPYEVERTQTAKNSLGWDFYLVTDKGINSLDDVRADYHKIFSEGYKDAISETYIESDGRVYCLCGERGSNIFYEYSTVSEIKSKSDSEVSFTVDSYYTDDGFGKGAYVSHDDFTAVIDSDGVWRVKEFRLPY